MSFLLFPYRRLPFSQLIYNFPFFIFHAIHVFVCCIKRDTNFNLYTISPICGLSDLIFWNEIVFGVICFDAF